MSDTTGSTFGSRLVQLMKRRGLKNPAVAEATGVHPGTVSKWRTGPQKPDNDQLPKLAELLGTTQSYLLFGDQSHPGRVAEPEQRYDVIIPQSSQDVNAIPRLLLVQAKRFELEAVEAGADDFATAFIRKTLSSPEASAMYHGGYKEPSIAQMTARQEAIIKGLRIWLGDYLTMQAAKK